MKARTPDPYEPGPQGDDRPGLGCPLLLLRLLLLAALVVGAVAGRGPIVVAQEFPPITAIRCCYTYMPLVLAPCQGEVCPAGAFVGGEK